jgi:serine/threonine protein kinase
LAKVRKAKSEDGKVFDFYDNIIGAGGMKDVYFSTDGQHAVAFYRAVQDATSMERIRMLTGRYRERIFEQEGGDYWRNLLCWPTHMVRDLEDDRVGIILPKYPSHFFFEHGSVQSDMLGISGKEKEGKWYASPRNRYKFLDPRERGNWLSYLRICVLISRATKRFHAAGLAHSDLSYKNVLVDPVGGNACIIDIDGLVVPGRFPPDVIGTPDFIAPEVIKTQFLDRKDPKRFLPSINTDRYALAVLIYMYLFLRHPLKGKKIHDPGDIDRDEQLSMGEKALFVEHHGDVSNSIDVDSLRPEELFWGDTGKLPYTVSGLYLSKLFERAFIEGLHTPEARPSADEWEQALVKTVDLIQPCANSSCEQGWYVFDNSTKPKCPFCGTPYKGKLPVLNLYSSRGKSRFMPDNHRLMVYTNQSLYPWHANRLIVPNERMTDAQKKRVGYFVLHNERWLFVNENLPDLTDLATNQPVPIGQHIELRHDAQILLSKENGGRLIVVQMVDA